MPLVATDLILYASASIPTDDDTTSGGAIDPKRRLLFTDVSGKTVRVVSDNAGDTQNCTVVGRTAAGTLVTETKALTGVTPVNFTETLDRILSIQLASDATGIITCTAQSGDAAICTIPAGERGVVRLFQNAESEDVPAARYEKVFLKNTHGSLDLLTASVVESADPEGIISFTLAAAIDDSESVADRKTAPGASIIEPDTFDGTEKSVPGESLASGEAIGIWIKQSLTATNAPFENTYTLEVAGASS